MTTATVAEFTNNINSFMEMVQNGQDIIVLNDGIEVARLVSKNNRSQSISRSLLGVIPNVYDEKELRAERMKRHESTD